MPSRPAFTLTELLVVIAIILLLMTLLGTAVSAARSGAKISSTRATIDKLNTILTTQLAKYDSRSVAVPTSLPSGIPTRSSYRAWFIRRNMISADLPDRWNDVAFMAANPGSFTSPSQRAYISIWNGANAAGRVPTGQFEGAECLFMIVMRGGIADCLDCGALRTSEVGDQDTDGAGNIVGDGMPEFIDAWGRPIDYILWCPAIDVPAESGNRFFSGARAPDAPFPASGVTPAPALRLKPLIYSAGPDGKYSVERRPGSTTIDVGANPTGRDCGNWEVNPALSCGLTSSGAADNITNLDEEAKQ